MLLIPVEMFWTIFNALTFLVDPSFEMELVLEGFFVLTRLAELACLEEERFMICWSSVCLDVFVLIFLAGTFPRWLAEERLYSITSSAADVK